MHQENSRKRLRKEAIENRRQAYGTSHPRPTCRRFAERQAFGPLFIQAPAHVTLLPNRPPVDTSHSFSGMPVMPQFLLLDGSRVQNRGHAGQKRNGHESLH